MHTQHQHSLRTAAPLAALSALWHWLMARPGQSIPDQDDTGSQPHLTEVAVAPAHQPAAVARLEERRAGPHLPLRVLRVMEGGPATAQIGRLRISGRMADVCAELDRLAAHEAMSTLHPG